MLKTKGLPVNLRNLAEVSTFTYSPVCLVDGVVALVDIVYKREKINNCCESLICTNTTVDSYGHLSINNNSSPLIIWDISTDT